MNPATTPDPFEETKDVKNGLIMDQLYDEGRFLSYCNDEHYSSVDKKLGVKITPEFLSACAKDKFILPIHTQTEKRMTEKGEVEMEVKYYSLFQLFLVVMLHKNTIGKDGFLSDPYWGSQEELKTRYISWGGQSAFNIENRHSQVPVRSPMTDHYVFMKDFHTFLRFLHTLPTLGAYGEDITQMVGETAIDLARVFRKMIFKDGKMVANLSVVHQIEQRIYWFDKTKVFSSPEITKLREDILNDKEYSLFRLLAGDPTTYSTEVSWDVAEKQRSDELGKIIKSINNSNWEKFANELNNISSQIEFIDEWRFVTFRNFLSKLSQTKPNIAEKILNRSFKQESYLKKFSGSILEGFRISDNFILWDKFVKVISDNKDIKQCNSMLDSLLYKNGTDLKKALRNKDLKIVEDIVKKRKPFSFLKKQKAEDRVLHFSLVRALIRNYKRDPKLFESLISFELANYSEYAYIYLHEIYLGILTGDIVISNWNKKKLAVLQKRLVEIPELGYEQQELLLAMADGKLNVTLDIFMKRIKSKINKRAFHNLEGRYEAIPYHLNDTVKSHINSHTEYIKQIKKWLPVMTKEWSLYNWEVSHFIKRVGGSYEELILSLIQDNTEISLTKALNLMDGLDIANIGLCIEVARRTTNKNLLDKARSQCYKTGVVSGHYGLAESYEQRAKEMGKYIDDDKSLKVKEFAKNMQGNFLENARIERIRADDEKLQREVDFNVDRIE